MDGILPTKATSKGRGAASRSWTSKLSFVRFSFFFSHPFLFSRLDREGDELLLEETSRKSPKHKANKKAMKDLHEKVIVRLNPPASTHPLHIYPFFPLSLALQDRE